MQRDSRLQQQLRILAIGLLLLDALGFYLRWIAEAPEPGYQNSHPKRLDHFVFKRKTLHGQEVVWEPAPDITETHAAKLTELGIVFLHDDPEENSPN